MNEWGKCQLSDLVDIKGGFSYKGKYIGEGSSYLLGMGCVSFNKKFLHSGARLYSGEYPKNHLVKPGDLVLATRQQSDNMPILGLPAIVPDDYANKDVIVGTNLYKVFNSSDVKNSYLYWLLKSPSYLNHILSCAGGTTVKMITKDAVETFKFNLPKEEKEREAISDTLWNLEYKVDLHHRQNKTLEELAQTLFRQWFIVNAKDDWEDGTLGDFTDNPRVSIKPSQIMKNTKYIGLEHIERRHISLMRSGDSESVASNKYEFKENDILFGKLRPYFHKVCFTSHDGICSTDILVIRPKEAKYFAFTLFAFFQDDVVKYANSGSEGTRMPRTNWNILKEYSIQIPDDDLIEKFNIQVLPMIEKIKKNQQQIKTLENMRDKLVPKLMSGDVRINY